jgi:hypothetical protein
MLFLSGSSLGGLSRVGGEAPRVRLIWTDSFGNPEWCRHSLGSGPFFFPPPNALYIKRAKDRILLGPFVFRIRLEEAFIKKLQDDNAALQMNDASLLAEALSSLTEDLRGTQDCVRSAVERVFSLQDKYHAGLNAPNDRNELLKSSANEHLAHDLAQAQLVHKIADFLKSRRAVRGPGNNNRPGDGNVSASLVKGIDLQDDVLAWEFE